jgi:ABC-type transport system substrate-binding protein
MSLDRDLYIDTFFNVSKFEQSGLPVDTRWNSAIPATREGWWIDPKGKDFGPNSAYFQHNMEEAKKLMAAAGLSGGIPNNKSSYVTTQQLPDVAKHAQILDGMTKDLGINSSVNSLAYPQEYAGVRDGKGKYDGWGYKYTPGGAGGHVIGVLSAGYLTNAGPYFFGFDAAGKGDQTGDPEIDALITKGRTTRDETQLKSIVADIQKKLAGHVYAIPMPGTATTFTMAWPALGNFGVFRGSAIPNWGLWVDQTKAPFV